MSQRKFLSLMLSLAALGCAAGSASATTTLNATDSGFYNNGTTTTGGNYATGWFVGGTSEEIRDFFTFDLTGITGTITSAKLTVTMPQSGYLSPDPTETLTLFDVTTSPATLSALTPSSAIFADLGTGTVYGSAALGFVPAGNTVDIPLNAAGIAFLNANHSPIALGGAVTTFTVGDPQDEALFNSSSAAGTRQLILEVTPTPEPASALLLGCGILALARRRGRGVRAWGF